MNQLSPDNVAIAVVLLGIAGLLAFTIWLIRMKRRADVFRDIYQLAELTELFALAEIPQLAEERFRSAGVQAEGDRGMGKPFQVLQSNVLLSFRPHTPIRLLVTSPEPREGKSFIAANLAISLAGLDKRVLLVDATRSRRVLHKWLQLDDGLGLADLVLALKGERTFSARDLERLATKYIQQTSVKNLFLMTSGHGDSSVTYEMLAEAPSAILDNYEVVIVDAPSLKEVQNLKQVPYWHDVLLVSKLNQTSLRAIENATERLEARHVHTIGIVVNGVPVEQIDWQGQSLVAASSSTEESAPEHLAVEEREASLIHQDDKAADLILAKSLNESVTKSLPALEQQETIAGSLDAEPASRTNDAELEKIRARIAAQDVMLAQVFQQLEHMDLESAQVRQTAAEQRQQLDEMRSTWESEREWYHSTLQTTLAGMETLHESVLKQQELEKTLQEKAHEFEAHINVLQEQGAELLGIGVIHAQIQRQQEVARLKTVAAEYRLILERKEKLLETFADELAEMRLALSKQQTELQFYKSVTDISDESAEGSLSGQRSSDISAD